MRSLLRRRQPEDEGRPKLAAELKKWYQEEVTIENPLAAFYPPGSFENERKARFFIFQCPHCKTIHTGACPAVRSIEQYENGNVKRVIFNETWDDSNCVTFEDVFGDEEAD